MRCDASSTSAVAARALRILRPVRPDARGFTLMEVLIALSIFLIVLFAVYSSFESSRATYAAGEQRADIQQSARIAMELVSADLRLAGFGYPVGAGNAITGATPTSITFWADLTNASTIVDTTNVNPGNATISVTDASGFAAGDTLYIINGGQWDQVIVQSITDNVPPTPDVITISDPGGVECRDVTGVLCALPWSFPWGSQVSRPRLIQYSWAGDILSKDDDMGDALPLQPLAGNIQNFQMVYFDASNNAPVTSADIRRITVTVGVQSPPGWWRQQAFTIVSDIRLRNL
jgi:prepilin-type N-terminal cleavage/methylation domain-containing protein